jgi:hypothetical protein
MRGVRTRKESMRRRRKSPGRLAQGPRPAGLARFRGGSASPLSQGFLGLFIARTLFNSASIHPEHDENLEPRPERDDDRRKSSMLPRRWLRLDPSRHGWPCVVKPWRSSGAMPWIIKARVQLNGDINLILSSL